MKTQSTDDLVIHTATWDVQIIVILKNQYSSGQVGLQTVCLQIDITYAISMQIKTTGNYSEEHLYFCTRHLMSSFVKCSSWLLDNWIIWNAELNCGHWASPYIPFTPYLFFMMPYCYLSTFNALISLSVCVLVFFTMRILVLYLRCLCFTCLSSCFSALSHYFLCSLLTTSPLYTTPYYTVLFTDSFTKGRGVSFSLSLEVFCFHVTSTEIRRILKK